MSLQNIIGLLFGEVERHGLPSPCTFAESFSLFPLIDLGIIELQSAGFALRVNLVILRCEIHILGNRSDASTYKKDHVFDGRLARIFDPYTKAEVTSREFRWGKPHLANLHETLLS